MDEEIAYVDCDAKYLFNRNDSLIKRMLMLLRESKSVQAIIPSEYENYTFKVSLVKHNIPLRLEEKAI